MNHKGIVTSRLDQLIEGIEVLENEECWASRVIDESQISQTPKSSDGLYECSETSTKD